MTTFNWLPAGDFMDKVFELEPLHIKNVLPPEYFSINDLDSALTRSVSSILPFTIGMHGRVPNRNEYCSEIYNPIKHAHQIEIDPEKVQSLLERGANLKIQRFATLSEKVALIVQDIESWLGFATSSNGYFSFGMQRGLAIHWDSHDVLAVQLIGKKNWKIFRPGIELPVKAHRNALDAAPNPGSAYLDVELQAGDALYIPRGWWHDVMPVRGQKTLHASVGLHPPNRADFVGWILNHEILRNVEFRRSLLQDGPPPNFAPMIASLAAALSNPGLTESYWKQYAASVRTTAPFKLGGQK